MRDAGLPLPQLNVLVDGFLVDAYWPRARLVVELQSWEHHGHRQAFERDNSKRARLQLAGYTALTLTDRQLRCAAEWIVCSVRTELEATTASTAVRQRALAGGSL
jgi:very-short-patch-repair endonuclease